MLTIEFIIETKGICNVKRYSVYTLHFNFTKSVKLTCVFHLPWILTTVTQKY